MDPETTEMELREIIGRHEREIAQLKDFRKEQQIENERLKVIIREMKDQSRWIRNTFTTLLLAGSGSGVVSAVKFTVGGGLG